MSQANPSSEGFQYTTEVLATIRKVATKLAYDHSLLSADAEVFIEEAASFVFERSKHYDSTRPLWPWVETVLRNKMISEHRQRKSRRNLFKRVCEHLTEDDLQTRPELRDVYFWEPFDEAEMKQLRMPPSRSRFVSCVLHELWRKVPEIQWRQWRREHKIAKRSFPSKKFQASRRQIQIQRLAKLLCVSESAVRMADCRGRNQLRKLGFFQVREKE